MPVGLQHPVRPDQVHHAVDDLLELGLVRCREPAAEDEHVRHRLRPDRPVQTFGGPSIQFRGWHVALVVPGVEHSELALSEQFPHCAEVVTVIGTTSPTDEDDGSFTHGPSVGLRQERHLVRGRHVGHVPSSNSARAVNARDTTVRSLPGAARVDSRFGVNVTRTTV